MATQWLSISSVSALSGFFCNYVLKKGGSGKAGVCEVMHKQSRPRCQVRSEGLSTVLGVSTGMVMLASLLLSWGFSQRFHTALDGERPGEEVHL